MSDSVWLMYLLAVLVFSASSFFVLRRIFSTFTTVALSGCFFAVGVAPVALEGTEYLAPAWAATGLHLLFEGIEGIDRNLMPILATVFLWLALLFILRLIFMLRLSKPQQNQ